MAAAPPPMRQLQPPLRYARHPTTAMMVREAIHSMNVRGGVSLAAIKKYVVANYLLDPQKSRMFVLRYIKKAVASGELVQTKGRGASGCFKLSTKAKAKAKTVTKDKTKTKDKVAGGGRQTFDAAPKPRPLKQH